MTTTCRVAATALLAVATLLSPGSAMAMGCGDVPHEGICSDKQTMSWCEAGVVKSAKCPDGEICVEETPWFDAAGCVAPSDTDCGEITTEGECTTANAVVWCEDGAPMVQACDEGSVCGWDADHGWYDCLSGPGASSDDGSTDDAPGATPPEQTQEGASESDEGSAEDEALDTPDLSVESETETDDEDNEPSADEPESSAYTDDPSIPSPTVDRGLSSQEPSNDAPAQILTGDGSGGGCAGKPGPTPDSTWLLGLLILAFIGRRPTHRLT